MGAVATAPGDDPDFVSRYFAPCFGIDEDPVTGSSHCALAPYWARRLGTPELYALQVSSRGGKLYCRVMDSRVSVAGHATCHLLHGRNHRCLDDPACPHGSPIDAPGEGQRVDTVASL